MNQNACWTMIVIASVLGCAYAGTHDAVGTAMFLGICALGAGTEIK